MKKAVKLIPNLVGVKAMPRFLQRFSLEQNQRNVEETNYQLMVINFTCIATVTYSRY